MRRVVYEPRALQELRHEVRWYEARARGRGERLLVFIEQTIRAIAEAPAMEIAKVGRFSVVQDPTGAVFSPFRSART